MADTVLVGSTGFVGGNLMASHHFDAAYHSTNIEQGFDQPNGLVVYAGVPAAMFLANADPDADLAVMKKARQNLQKLRPQQVVLISSIAVYQDSRGKTEASPMEMKGLSAYGANRLLLEQWVRQDFPNALIVRLPALYGRGLKKNFLYDLRTLTPTMLSTEKYEQLAKHNAFVKYGYSDAGNGFWKLNAQADEQKLRAFFEQNEFNALAFTDSRSVYQFYDLSQLWGHIQKALDAGLTLVNLTTPPVSAAEVYQAATGKEFVNYLDKAPFDYDLRSLYADVLGGTQGYLCTKEQELASVVEFLKSPAF